jgi:kynurenine 3-monooxygenase
MPLRERILDLLKERKDVVTFETNFPDSIDVIPELAEDFFKNPTSTS